MTSEKSFYKLRVNINGFELKDIKVCLVNKDNSVVKTPKTKQDKKVRVKISATRKEYDNTDLNNTSESIREYVKHYEILSESNVDATSMRYYLDPRNTLYLVVEFISNANENHYINLDDSCDSLVEMAAKSLLNVKNIEDLRNAIENPFDSINDYNLTEVFAPSLIKDLNIASLTSFTPINIVQDSNFQKKVQIKVNIPYQIKTVGLDSSNYQTSVKRIQTNFKSIENLPDESIELKNHLTIKCDNLNLLLEANTVKENVSSLFTKQFKLPKGSLVKELRYKLDQPSHSLYLEAPFLD